jgi:predicted PP-loop superfamily ATPase
MARCHICNTKLDVVEVDERDGRIKPCGDCQEEIDDAVYGDDDEELFTEQTLIEFLGDPSEDDN